MGFLFSFLILGCGLAALSQTANGQENQYTFDSDLGSLVSTNGVWGWYDRDGLPWELPDGPDGFAALYMPGNGDMLYDPEVDIQNGFDFQITYFLSSEAAGDTVLKLQQLDEDGNVLQDIQEFQSDPDLDTFLIASGSYPVVGTPSRFGIFCQTSAINILYGKFYGCAIDSLTLNVHPEPTTTEEPVVQSTTSAAPTPEGTIDYTFEENGQGWLLGSSNGASWERVEYAFSETGIAPPSGDYVLALQFRDVYSGVALATSPRLRVGDSGVASVQVEFYIAASPEYPAYLKLRRRLSYTTYNEDVVLNMDPWGDQVNLQWLTLSETFDDLIPGDEFSIVLEGNLGITNERNLIYVSRVTVQGLIEIPYEEETVFDFTDGLVGWQPGSMDGGKWEVVPYADLDPILNIPPSPTFTPNILIATRYDIHSGVISIESPPIEVTPNTEKILQIRIFVRGSQVYPVIFRLGLKTLDGVYDALPFVDLTPQGDADSQIWMTLGQRFPTQSTPRASYLQLVFEVDLGGSLNNLIAIDQFEIRTTDLSG